MKKTYLVLIALSLLMAGCSDSKESSKKAPVRVKTEVIDKSPSVTLQSGGDTYVGIVEEHESTAVSFTGMGVVRQMLVREGQAVGRGQLLAVMDDTQARNLLTSAEATMAQANDALQRYGMLHDNGSLPEVQWVEIQSKVAQAKAQLDVAKKNVSDCRLTAPVSGIIGRKLVGAGETVMPSQAVVTILNINSVKVKVAVPEAEMNRIAPNTSSIIRVEAANKLVNGGRIEKGVQADAMTHTYDVRINVPNADHRLLPGMVASVAFGGGSPKAGQMGLLPVTSVQRRADGHLFVWTVAADSTVHRTDVTIGSTQGNRIIIINGVSSGQRVVTEGYQKLSEGTRVTY